MKRLAIVLTVMTGLLLGMAGCMPRAKGPDKQPAGPDKTTTETSVIPDKGPDGKATPGDIKDATGTGNVPQGPIPPGAKWVQPDQLGSEVAAVFKKVYFNYDRYDLSPEAQAVLKGIAAYLLDKNTKMKVMIEGHCDERGTREYNLVLGDQRANSVRRYLVSVGVAPGRLFPTSYGKDKPEDPRPTEQAWAKNRRCQFRFPWSKQ